MTQDKKAPARKVSREMMSAETWLRNHIKCDSGQAAGMLTEFLNASDPDPAPRPGMTEHPLVQNAKDILEDLYNSSQLAGSDEVSKRLRTRIGAWFQAFETHARDERRKQPELAKALK